MQVVKIHFAGDVLGQPLEVSVSAIPDVERAAVVSLRTGLAHVQWYPEAHELRKLAGALLTAASELESKVLA